MFPLTVGRLLQHNGHCLFANKVMQFSSMIKKRSKQMNVKGSATYPSTLKDVLALLVLDDNNHKSDLQCLMISHGDEVMSEVLERQIQESTYLEHMKHSIPPMPQLRKRLPIRDLAKQLVNPGCNDLKKGEIPEENILSNYVIVVYRQLEMIVKADMTGNKEYALCRIYKTVQKLSELNPGDIPEQILLGCRSYIALKANLYGGKTPKRAVLYHSHVCSVFNHLSSSLLAKVGKAQFESSSEED